MCKKIIPRPSKVGIRATKLKKNRVMNNINSIGNLKKVKTIQKQQKERGSVPNHKAHPIS